MANAAPHYVWAAGHFVLLAASLRYLFGWVTFHASPLGFWYKTAFTGAIVSYAIVVYKSLGVPQPSGAYIRKAMADENFQYFALAIFWFFTKPIALALVPYATFSLFHALTFTRANVIPRVFPPTPAATAGDRPQPHPLSKTIHAWVKANYDSAMRAVAWAELAIMLRVTLGAVFGMIPFIHHKMPFKNSLLTPLLFAHFLRLRFFYSTFTRQVLQNVDGIISRHVDGPSAHPLLKKVWDPARNAIRMWGSSALQPQPAAPAGSAAGAPGPARR